MTKFEYAARAIVDTEALQAGMGEKARTAHVEKTWRSRLPECEASYNRFIERQIKNGARPLKETL